MPSIPTTIDRYQILSELGRGGMAIVYHAHDPRFRRDVAIKVLPREFLYDPTFRARFEKEAQAVAALDHPAIVPVYDIDEHEGQPFLVMRYMAGGSLAKRLKEGPLTLDEAALVVERIGRALDRAHQRGIIHRDVKPSNILFDEYGDAYLTDFGIAKIVESTTQLTGSGIVGTPHYMAPEMADPGGVTPLVDVYALGVTLFQMLTGRVPYDAPTPMGILMAHISKPIPDVRLLRPDLPDAVQRVIEGALAKDPRQRYQSAGALVRDLKAALHGDVVPVVAAPAVSAPPKGEDTPQKEKTEEGRTVYPPQTIEPAEWPQQPTPPLPQHRPMWMGVQGGILALLAAALVIAVGAAIVANSLLRPRTSAQATPVPSTPISATGAVAAEIATQVPTTILVEQPVATRTPTTSAAIAAMPRAARLAFHSDRSGNWDIYLTSEDGTLIAQLTTDPASDISAVWSPDGTKLAFVSNRDGNPEIYVMNADGSNQTRLTNNQADDAAPAWSPDGNFIAFQSSRDGATEIYVMRADGSNQTRLTNDPAEDRFPTWSPDGQQIAFASTRRGNWDIYIMEANGSNVRRLVGNQGADKYPRWSPDGKSIAFESDRDGDLEIYIIDVDGTGLAQVTRNAVHDEYPSWSPDGSRIAFCSMVNEGWEIFIASVDGVVQRQLTHDSSNNVYPAWRP